MVSFWLLNRLWLPHTMCLSVSLMSHSKEPSWCVCVCGGGGGGGGGEYSSLLESRI